MGLWSSIIIDFPSFTCKWGFANTCRWFYYSRDNIYFAYGQSEGRGQARASIVTFYY